MMAPVHRLNGEKEVVCRAITNLQKMKKCSVRYTPTCRGGKNARTMALDPVMMFRAASTPQFCF